MKKFLVKLWKSSGMRSVLSSLICIAAGILIGFLVLLCINPAGAFGGIAALLKNFMNYSNPTVAIKYFGNTLVKTAPLLLCALSILFCYKVGLFNIGAAGQYTVGAGLALYTALKFGMPWYLCMLFAILAGMLFGTLIGILKAYCNVNEVISGIMFNWISLYGMNMLLTNVKESTSPYTSNLSFVNQRALLPSLGLGKLFGGNKYVSIALPLSVLTAVAVWIVLNKTKFGYEMKATGLNRHAARYCGMAEKRNVILSLAIGGGLAAMGAALFYLTGYEQWSCGQSSVPAMGFNGIAAAFLGGLHPIGTIFSSYFIQHITVGGAYVDKSIYCSQISDLISSIIIYLCGFSLFIRYLLERAADRRAEREAKDAKPKEVNEHSLENGTDKGGDQ